MESPGTLANAKVAIRRRPAVNRKSLRFTSSLCRRARRPESSQINEAVRETNGFAADDYTFAAIFTPQVAAAGRYLPRVQLFLAQPIGPVRDQRAVCGARDWVFRNTEGGREVTRYEIDFFAGRGCDHTRPVQLPQDFHVRRETPDIVFG